jgi:hypothetical protein
MYCILVVRPTTRAIGPSDIALPNDLYKETLQSAAVGGVAEIQGRQEVVRRSARVDEVRCTTSHTWGLAMHVSSGQRSS